MSRRIPTRPRVEGRRPAGAQSRQRRLADDTQRRIRTEFRLNRAAVAGVKDKHVAYLKRISDCSQRQLDGRHGTPRT